MTDDSTTPIPVMAGKAHNSAPSTSAPAPAPTTEVQKLASVANIMRCVSTGFADGDRLQSVVTQIQAALNASDVVLCQTCEDGQLAVMHTSRGTGDAEFANARVPVGDPIIRRAIEAEAPLLLMPRNGSDGFLKLSDSLPAPKRQYIVSLRNGEELMGALIVNSLDPKAPAPDESALVEIFAGQIRCCLQQGQLRASLQTTEESLRDQFLRAEKMRTMGEMASGVFHDFNNILGAVVGRVQLIHYKTEDEDIKRSLSQIERIALQGAETVKRLQEFSRLHQQREIGPTDLNRVIDDALEVTRHRWESQAQKRGVSYTIERRQGQDVIVPGIHAQLVDAVANLIRNALDAMEGGGKLSFETTRSGNLCRLAVRDEGHGMTPEQVEKVFAPFFTTKGAQGTGLGMTVVQDIVRNHDGTISIESQPHKGTTFRLEFPVYKDADAPPEEIEAEPTSDSLRLLVVDDDHIILDVVSEALQDAGHSVDSFSHGSDAINAIEKNRYDVVVTDLGMPDVTGWEVARSAKLHNPNLPVVVISGWGAQFADEQLTDSGVDAMLAKPFHLQLLRETIERLAKGDTKGIPTVRR